VRRRTSNRTKTKRDSPGYAQRQRVRILAEQPFTEAKKYLVLCAATPDTLFGMPSVMVDEAWRTFVLFTTEYTEYGHRYFGQYVHHAPVGEHGGPEGTGGRPQEAASFNDFRQRYEELYGHPLPDVWYDDNSVAQHVASSTRRQAR
jgi:hypothetical protein